MNGKKIGCHPQGRLPVELTQRESSVADVGYFGSGFCTEVLSGNLRRAEICPPDVYPEEAGSFPA